MAKQEKWQLWKALNKDRTVQGCHFSCLTRRAELVLV